jgi:hypothetical protein
MNFIRKNKYEDLTKLDSFLLSLRGDRNLRFWSHFSFFLRSFRDKIRKVGFVLDPKK